MKNRFIPLQIEKVLEERGQHPFSVQVLLEALELLESEYSSFCTQEGAERAETVFSYRTVKRALQQCLAYHQNNNSSLKPRVPKKSSHVFRRKGCSIML